MLRMWESVSSSHARPHLPVSAARCLSSSRRRRQVPDIGRAMELGREAAGFVSATFIKPIKLEFEKACAATRPMLRAHTKGSPLLLINFLVCLHAACMMTIPNHPEGSVLCCISS